jgi:hypothetical protein
MWVYKVKFYQVQSSHLNAATFGQTDEVTYRARLERLDILGTTAMLIWGLIIKWR